MPRLMLRFELDEDDGEPKLFAKLEVDAFSGASQFWCGPSEFSDLPDLLRPFPLRGSVRGEWVGGAIKLAVEPFDTTGTLLVSATLIDNYDSRKRCEAVFTTHYAELDTFRRQLDRALENGFGEAHLT